jgi:putative ABC transport system permease protein
MWRSPAFAVVSITTMALAIAVNTAIFSIVSVIVFADLPMENQDDIAVVRSLNPGQGITRGEVSYADFLDMRERATTFEAMAAMGDAQWVLSTDDREPLRVSGQRITANMLDVWGLTMPVGRGFLPGEDVPGAEPVVILAHGFWQRSFAGRTDVVGSTLKLDGRNTRSSASWTPKWSSASSPRPKYGCRPGWTETARPATNVLFSSPVGSPKASRTPRRRKR